MVREWAWYRKYDAHILDPLQHPCVEVVILVEQASEQSDGGQNEEAAEEADPYHQPFQFISSLAVDFHHRPNAKQRYEAGHQEYGANREIDAERQQQKHAERMRVQLTDKAYSG